MTLTFKSAKILTVVSDAAHSTAVVSQLGQTQLTGTTPQDNGPGGLNGIIHITKDSPVTLTHVPLKAMMTGAPQTMPKG